MADYRRHNERVLKTLEEGDLVEFDRGFIKHWGVYVGGKEIVHLYLDKHSGKGCVKKEDFWSVVEQSPVKKKNNKDQTQRAYSRDDIKKRALSMLGPSKYCVTTFNCEHFANLCRYGKEESAQVDTGVFVGKGVSVGIFLAIGTAVLSLMGFSSVRSMTSQ